MNLEDVILLFEISKSQTGIAGFHTQGTWSSQNREDRKYNGDFGEERVTIINEYKVSVLQDEKNYGVGWW